MPLESSCFKIENSVNEIKGSLNAKSSSIDHSEDDSIKQASQKSPSEKNVSDDFTEANNNVSNLANSMKTAGSISGQEKLKQFRDECLGVARFFELCHKSFIKVGTIAANKSEVKSAIFDLEEEVVNYNFKKP